jgi:hypothetical protein
MSKIHQLSGVLNDSHRHYINAVVEQVSATPPKDSIALKLMPTVNLPAAIIEHEVLSGVGGKTNERVLNAEGVAIAGRSSTPNLFKPGSYQEHIPMYESDLLTLRKLGSIGDRGVTGLTGGELNWLDMHAKKLDIRLKNRLHQLIWDALFLGQFVYQGRTYSFGVPSSNIITTATNWSQPKGSPDAGNPFMDIVTIIMQNPYLRKYKDAIKGLVINPNTEANIILRSLEQGYITNNNIQTAGINDVRKFAAPQCPEFTVVSDRMQDETVAADGTITLGNAYYMVPDNQCLVMIDFGQTGTLFPEYGQLQLTENMNDPSATLDRPAVGIYTFVDEKGLEARKSPHLDVVSGFNGGPNLMRPFDVFIIQSSVATT